jgi:hypothetical protein
MSAFGGKADIADLPSGSMIDGQNLLSLLAKRGYKFKIELV